MHPYIMLGLFPVLGFFFAWGAVSLSGLLAPSRPSVEKGTPYECGEETIGEVSQFHPGYYLTALVFLIFEVEAVFLFPILPKVRALGTEGVVAVALFVAVLFLGLLYAWRREVIAWR